MDGKLFVRGPIDLVEDDGVQANGIGVTALTVAKVGIILGHEAQERHPADRLGGWNGIGSL